MNYFQSERVNDSGKRSDKRTKEWTSVNFTMPTADRQRCCRLSFLNGFPLSLSAPSMLSPLVSSDLLAWFPLERPSSNLSQVYRRIRIFFLAGDRHRTELHRCEKFRIPEDWEISLEFDSCRFDTALIQSPCWNNSIDSFEKFIIIIIIEESVYPLICLE